MITITNFRKNSELFNSTIGFILIIFIVSTLFPQKLQAQSEIKEKLDKMLNGFPQKAPGGVVVSVRWQNNSQP